MSRPAPSAVARPEATPTTAPSSEGGLLLRTFNELRDELVSTLCFILGSADDAQDLAQETFLRCWRTQHDLAGVQNLRAWIFRVALNAAKDLQRSAWKRRSKPLLGAETMPILDSTPPERGLEEQESLTQLRQALLQLRPEEQEV